MWKYIMRNKIWKRENVEANDDSHSTYDKDKKPSYNQQCDKSRKPHDKDNTNQKDIDVT